MTTAPGIFAADQAAQQPPDYEMSVAVEVERFLSGDSDGREVLSLLYGSVADEPVPERFRALLRRRVLRLVEG